MKYIFKAKGEDAGLRLDVFLKKNLANFSREKIKKAIVAGSVRNNGKPVLDPSFTLAGSETFEIEIAETVLRPEKMELAKLFENDDFLVIDKPAGLVVHPGAGVQEGTLANALVAQYPEMHGWGEHFRPGIVHRLDKDTSGVMLIAKNERALEYAKLAFKNRNVGKEYLALVHGKIEKPHGFIDKPLELAPKLRKVRVAKGGKNALTEYKVLGYYQDPETLDPVRSTQSASNNLNGSHEASEKKASYGVDQYTLIRVILHTGRTHQIRVHLASEGHPLAGDSLYGKGKPVLLNRQFLHAVKLSFPLPDGTRLDIESPLPSDLEKVLNNLKKLQ